MYSQLQKYFPQLCNYVMICMTKIVTIPLTFKKSERFSPRGESIHISSFNFKSTLAPSYLLSEIQFGWKIPALLNWIKAWGFGKNNIGIKSSYTYSEKAKKFCEISTVDLSYVVTVKSTVEISQNFVAFSEYMNFSTTQLLTMSMRLWEE